MSNQVNYHLHYQRFNTSTKDTVVKIDITWDNPIHEDVIAERVNSWFAAIGLDLEVVPKETKK